jgi:hypothetical protein
VPPKRLDPGEFLSATRLIVVAGKGGVGKTTVTAVLARAACEIGLRVLVVELDGKPQLRTLVGDIPTLGLTATDALAEYLDTHGLAKPGHHDCGGIIRAMAAARNMVKPAGEWNRYTLTLQADLLQVDFNGERTIVLALDKSPMKDRPADGHVGFQDEAKRVWYRGVRIKELK